MREKEVQSPRQIDGIDSESKAKGGIDYWIVAKIEQP